MPRKKPACRLVVMPPPPAVARSKALSRLKDQVLATRGDHRVLGLRIGQEAELQERIAGLQELAVIAAGNVTSIVSILAEELFVLQKRRASKVIKTRDARVENPVQNPSPVLYTKQLPVNCPEAGA